MAKKTEERDPVLDLPLDEYLVVRQDRVKNALKLIGADSCPEKMLFLELLWKGDFEEVHAGQSAAALSCPRP